jgi:hypothetical protein
VLSAATSCAGAKGLTKRRLRGTPCERHCSELGPEGKSPESEERSPGSFGQPAIQSSRLAMRPQLLARCSAQGRQGNAASASSPDVTYSQPKPAQPRACSVSLRVSGSSANRKIVRASIAFCMARPAIQAPAVRGSEANPSYATLLLLMRFKPNASRSAPSGNDVACFRIRSTSEAVVLRGYAPALMFDAVASDNRMNDRSTMGDVPIAVELRRADVAGMNVTRPSRRGQRD